MDIGILELVASAVISGSVVSLIGSVLVKPYLTRIESEVKSRRNWHEESVAELLGPLNMQFLRTKRAFERWQSQNLYLEAHIVRTGNETVRDLLLSKGHLIPPDLLDDAGLLIEHYDVWLEKFEKQRMSDNPDMESSFVFVGPDGYPFPSQSEERFRQRFREYWALLYDSAP